MKIQQRRIRVGLEFNGSLKVYEGLDIKVSGTKHASPLQNEAAITIGGLSLETINYVLSESNPFAPKQKAARIIVEAGREGGSLFVVFQGDITKAEVSLPPDLNLTVKAKTNNANAAKIVVTNGRDVVRLRELSETVARNNNLLLNFQALDKNIANYQYTGTPAKQVQDLQDAGQVSAFVDDDTLVVKDADKPLTAKRRTLNEKSGMIGLPRLTESGIEVTYLVDGESMIGGQITIESQVNKSLNGDYKVEQLKFDMRTHSDEFYYIASCTRL